ncbi:hypothetical protein FA95DRAFT_1569327 [Auriscalpium vulgare]|uniref:Uncharacterized protein n=1 Tax=Auriscalpium vulgare TaxID=40419 RepID=A0ACB8S9E5_9AGAM|nr:hypothetical protein FA95DRAFT_1569327 [Auriscalpium vulgare]
MFLLVLLLIPLPPLLLLPPLAPKIRYHPYPSFNRESAAQSMVEDTEPPVMGYTGDPGDANQGSAPVPDFLGPIASEEDVENLGVVVGELEGPAGTARPRDFTTLVLSCAPAAKAIKHPRLSSRGRARFAAGSADSERVDRMRPIRDSDTNLVFSNPYAA